MEVQDSGGSHGHAHDFSRGLLTWFGLSSGIGLVGEALFGRDHDIVDRVFRFVFGCIAFCIGLIPVAIVLANLGVVNIV